MKTTTRKYLDRRKFAGVIYEDDFCTENPRGNYAKRICADERDELNWIAKREAILRRNKEWANAHKDNK